MRTLVDLDLPGMDGIEFMGFAAQEHLAKSIAVVSAMAPALLHTLQVMAKASGLRVLGAVEKPLTPGKLTHVLSLFKSGPVPSSSTPVVSVTVEQLAQALRNGETFPMFQPQVEFSNGKVVGVEALARWRTSDGQMVPAAQFIPMIENGGLIEELTHLMLV